MVDSDLPPSRAAQPMTPPPDADRPTAAMLKGDIDSGRTGDKVEVFDPGLSPLGTDDEAAGRPPSAFRVALARRYETAERWAKGAKKSGFAHVTVDGLPIVFIGFIGLVSATILVGIWLLSSGITASSPA